VFNLSIFFCASSILANLDIIDSNVLFVFSKPDSNFLSTLSDICSKLLDSFLSDFSKKFSKFLIKFISESLLFSIILVNFEFIFSLIFQLKFQNSLKISFRKFKLEFLFSNINVLIKFLSSFF